MQVSSLFIVPNRFYEIFKSDVGTMYVRMQIRSHIRTVVSL